LASGFNLLCGFKSVINSLPKQSTALMLFWMAEQELHDLQITVRRRDDHYG
jgi:hypothetical protein